MPRCSEGDCQLPRHARGLCNRHYKKLYNAGGVPRRGGISHRLQNVDSSTQRGDCSVCGKRVRLKSRYDGTWRCRAAHRAWDRTSAGKAYGRHRYRRRIAKKYGLDLDLLGDFLERRRLCGICKSATATDVDHDHDTGVVRGFLCGKCNRALGIFGDDAKGLKRVLEYLEPTA